MKRSVSLLMLIVVVVALSLALLPYIGLPYAPLEITAVQGQQYPPPLPVQAYLPLVFA